jgi:hypothetical protein
VADIPSYIKLADQDIYHEELSQTLQQNFGNNGVVIPSLTNAQLTVDIVSDPFGNQAPNTLANLMPNGSLWYVTDHAPPVLVAKINNVLVQLQTAAYP